MRRILGIKITVEGDEGQLQRGGLSSSATILAISMGLFSEAFSR